MADLFELIERVQVTLASSQVPEKDQLHEIHQELDDEIRRANKRLRECDALLANGHRSEAIQLAEHEPNLLDVVSILDFAELPEWNDYVAELGLTVTPELHIEIASDLNLAYTEDAPLDRHLRQFRFYSLARAPLRKRLSLLRKIAELDAGNPVWEKDQRSYEEVRLGQIKDEYFEANRNHDLEKLKGLATEVRGEWLLQPSKQLLSRINHAVKSINTVSAVEKLRQVADDLRAARKEDNLNWAAQLCEDWDALAKKCSEDSQEFQELREIARRTIAWVNDQRTVRATEGAFTKKVEQLQRALDSGMDIAELRRRHAAVARNKDFEFPDDLQYEYDQAILKLQNSQRTRKIVIAAGVAVLLLIIVIVVIMLIPSSAQAEHMESKAELIRTIDDIGANQSISCSPQMPIPFLDQRATSIG